MSDAPSSSQPPRAARVAAVREIAARRRRTAADRDELLDVLVELVVDPDRAVEPSQPRRGDRSMSKLTETDTVVRALRTFAQAFLSSLLAAWPASLVLDLEVYVLALAGAAYAGVTSLLTWLHNELEDAGRVRDRR